MERLTLEMEAAQDRREVITLDSLLKTPGMTDRLRQPYVLAHSSGMSWTYQNSAELKGGLCKAFTNNAAQYLAGTRDKTTCTQSLICTGLGMGKSRTLMMVPEFLEPVTKNKMVFTFNVAFENGTGYQYGEEKPNMSAVVDRICHHLLGTTTQFLTWHRQHTAGFTLDELIGGLCGTTPTKDVVCLLLLDGVHNLANNMLQPLENDPMRLFLRNELQALQLKNKYFVFTVCTLTARKSAVEALKGSSVARTYLPIPGVSEIPPIDESIGVTKHLFRFVKGHGRAVEALCTVKKENPSKTDNEVLDMVCAVLTTHYGTFCVSLDEQMKLLKYALLQKPLPDEVDIAQHLSQGLMDVRYEGGQSYLWPSLIWAVSNAELSGSLLAPYNFSNERNSSSFEAFLMAYRCTLSKLHDNDKEMEVVEMHKAAKWMTDPGSMTFRNIHLQPLYATSRTDTHGKVQPKITITGKCAPDARKSECKSFTGRIVRNASGAPHGDIFLGLKQNVNEVIQAKHSMKQPYPQGRKEFITAIKKEVVKAADATDVFMLHTTATLPKQCAKWCKKDDFLNGHIIGVVDATNFMDYFHFLAPLWLNDAESEQEKEALAAQAKKEKEKTAVAKKKMKEALAAQAEKEKKVRATVKTQADLKACVGQTAVDQRKVPSSGLLASRPMWPALSQLLKVPRYTWSTPLPQTGAGVLRRLCKCI